MGDSSNSSAEEKVKFFDGVKSEFKKITWPDKTSLARQTVAVTLVSVILGGIIAILDFFVQYGVSFLTK